MGSILTTAEAHAEGNLGKSAPKEKIEPNRGTVQSA